MPTFGLIAERKNHRVYPAIVYTLKTIDANIRFTLANAKQPFDFNPFFLSNEIFRHDCELKVSGKLSKNYKATLGITCMTPQSPLVNCQVKYSLYRPGGGPEYEVVVNYKNDQINGFVTLRYMNHSRTFETILFTNGKIQSIGYGKPEYYIPILFLDQNEKLKKMQMAQMTLNFGENNDLSGPYERTKFDQQESGFIRPNQLFIDSWEKLLNNNFTIETKFLIGTIERKEKRSWEAVIFDACQRIQLDNESQKSGIQDFYYYSFNATEWKLGHNTELKCAKMKENTFISEYIEHIEHQRFHCRYEQNNKTVLHTQQFYLFGTLCRTKEHYRRRFVGLLKDFIYPKDIIYIVVDYFD
jgi:hypothetical protein